MWDGSGANLGKRREQAGFPEKHWGCQMPKCQSGAIGQGGIRRSRAEEQSGHECVVRGTEQQQRKELENKEQDQEKAKTSIVHLSLCGQHAGRGLGSWVSQLESLLP